jgi:hypothetical protein
MDTKTRIKTPFKIVGYEEPGIAFEAEFKLPDDEVTDNRLVMRVEMEFAHSEQCWVRLLGRTQVREVVLMECSSVPIRNLGNVLYGFASIKNVPLLVFNPPLPA